MYCKVAVMAGCGAFSVYDLKGEAKNEIQIFALPKRHPAVCHIAGRVQAWNGFVNNFSRYIKRQTRVSHYIHAGFYWQRDKMYKVRIDLGCNFKIQKGVLAMKSSNYLIGLSILFFVFAAAFSVVFWGDVSLAAKIGLYVLGFGSGVTAGQWFARRSE